MMDIFSYFVIPVITLAMPGASGWLESNFSVVGSRTPGQFFLILWGFLTGGFFLCLLRRAIGQAASLFPMGKEEFLTDLSAVLLAISVCTPYLPEEWPILSALHVVFAFTAAALLYLIMVSLAKRAAGLRPDLFKRYAAALYTVPAVCAVLFILAGGIINSAMEIYYTVLCSVSLNLFSRRLKKSAPVRSETHLS